MSDTNPAEPEAELAQPVVPEAEPAPPVAPTPTAAGGVDVQTPQMVIAPRQGPGFLARAVWFVLVGWWLTAVVIAVAYVLALSDPGICRLLSICSTVSRPSSPSGAGARRIRSRPPPMEGDT